MLEKYFIPYDRALKLKELGFDEECLATIDQTEYVHIKGTKKSPRGSMMYDTIDCPLFCQVFDWFREKYNIIPNIHSIYTDTTLSEVQFWFWFANYEDDSDEEVFYGNFEEAQLACLDKLIEICEKSVV